MLLQNTVQGSSLRPTNSPVMSRTKGLFVAGANERAELAIDQKATLLLVVATWGNQVVDRDNVGVVSQTYGS
jgi:hypothetical protein